MIKITEYRGDLAAGDSRCRTLRTGRLATMRAVFDGSRPRPFIVLGIGIVELAEITDELLEER